MSGEVPQVGGLGVAYLLGGTVMGSITDPEAMAPIEGETQFAIGPSVLLIAPGGFDPSVFSTDPDSGEPFIVFDGTPMEALVAPVTPISADEMGDADPAVANAMSAGPAAIAMNATIVDWADDGTPSVVLREGTNEWTCTTDWPVSPGNDPACYDAEFTAWNDAYAVGAEPDVTGLGFAYMLAGGSDPSNTDPMAMEPAEGEDWVTTPPHVMIVVPGGYDSAVFTTDHASGSPYIMWDETPYEHLMLPVADAADMEMGDGQ
jgi:hypothetical protein